MKCSRILSLAVVVALFAMGSASQATMLANGDFELPGGVSNWSTIYSVDSTSLTGWTVTSGSVDLVGPSHWTAASGSLCVDLNGVQPGVLSQTFDTLAGQAYRVTFAMAANTDGPFGDFTMSVSAAGSSQNFTFTRTSAHTDHDMGWTYKTFDFIASLGTDQTTLTFASISTPELASGPVIDDVSVAETTLTPEPATLGMLSLGVLMLRRRRAQKS
ncbi:choice-of-anchor C family protein [Planctomycetales bacterium ZRK34]|nr:choice-of-anchor C family protein [Planctomycetales bacterium ZRK34]